MIDYVGLQWGCTLTGTLESTNEPNSLSFQNATSSLVLRDKKESPVLPTDQP
jgi:hypothetical protein